jgi:hypothetical protein
MVDGQRHVTTAGGSWHAYIPEVIGEHPQIHTEESRGGALVNGQWSTVNGQLSTVNGQRSTDKSRWSTVHDEGPCRSMTWGTEMVIQIPHSVLKIAHSVLKLAHSVLKIALPVHDLGHRDGHKNTTLCSKNSTFCSKTRTFCSKNSLASP